MMTSVMCLKSMTFTESQRERARKRERERERKKERERERERERESQRERERARERERVREVRAGDRARERENESARTARARARERECKYLDQLLRFHITDHLPEGLLLTPSPHVPDSVQNCPASKREHAFFRPNPAQLAVLRERAGEAHEVAEDVVLQALADDEVLQRLAHRGNDLVAAPESERKPVASREVFVVGAQDDVHARVLGRNGGKHADHVWRGRARVAGRGTKTRWLRTSGSLWTASLPSPCSEVGYLQSTTFMDVMTVMPSPRQVPGQ